MGMGLCAWGWVRDEGVIGDLGAGGDEGRDEDGDGDGDGRRKWKKEMKMGLEMEMKMGLEMEMKMGLEMGKLPSGRDVFQGQLSTRT